jgi:hypothetical protein
MAKSKSVESLKNHILKTKTKRPGIHSKGKNSINKKSKNYKKPYKSQGR